MWQEFLQEKCRREGLSPSLSRLLMGFPEKKIDQLNIHLYRHVKNIEQHKCNNACPCTECNCDPTFIKQKGDLFKKLHIDGYKLNKLYVLWQFLADEYLIYERQISAVPGNLKNVHKQFPLQVFQSRIEETLKLSQGGVQKEIWILQTFIPDFHNLTELLTQSIRNNIKVRILLIWTHSQFMLNREEALKRYAGISQEFSIQEKVIGNLENLESIINCTDDSSCNLEIRLYDSSPTISIYRSDNYILAGFFTHNKLAVNSFQLEIDINIMTNYINDDIVNEFNTIWMMGKDFSLELRNSNWRNSLENLF